MGRPKKDPFQDLDTEWKDVIAGMSVDEINNRIAEIAKNEQAIQAAKKEDADLNRIREEYKVASEGYREQTKAAKLMIKYCMCVLEDRGQE